MTTSGRLVGLGVLACGFALAATGPEAGAQAANPGSLQNTATAGKSGADDLVIADQGTSRAIVVVAATAGPNEKAGAADLVKYIEVMSGAKPVLASSEAEIADALKQAKERPLLILGTVALQQAPELQKALDKVVKKNPVLGADAIVLKRAGNIVYLAGNQDLAHGFAISALLRAWGCRWFMPTEFGECIPQHPTLKVGKLDEAYGSPLEVRTYWISWNGDNTGAADFKRRNFMGRSGVSGGHILGSYVKDLIPPGKSAFNVPIADDATAAHVAKQVAARFAKGEDFSLGMDDGLYMLDAKRDIEMRANLHDKYMLTHGLTDNFMELYNKVCENLLKANPDSQSHIGFLAYSNITLPPQRAIVAAKPLVASLAPIDIDPNHSMDDLRSPPKREYKEMLYRWAQVMQGRLFIYDYDQGMLVWRDLPNPVGQAFRIDVKHYAKAGILGIDTESRNAIATTFLNLYLRGQLMWNPEADYDQLLAEFYPAFYGPAAEPMAAYWTALFKAWEDTLVTEHEYMAIPAIYTPALITVLRQHLETAEATMKTRATAGGALPRDWARYQERMAFTRLSFNLVDQYGATVQAVATEADYAKAVALGEKAIATRLELAAMNPTFTTRISPKGPAPETVAGGPAWMLGEIEQYRRIGDLANGKQGTLIAKLPVEWAFHRDPHDTGLAQGYAYTPVDLTFWNAHGKTLKPEQRKDYPTDQWETLNVDIYAQAQGILHPDWQSFSGHLWYRTDSKLSAADVKGKTHLMFPGLFNEAWLYVNGYLVAHREFPAIWWLSDYKFEWDVDLAGVLKSGDNSITVRLNNPHHFGGIFRRPFLYRAN